jgi:putative transposase
MGLARSTYYDEPESQRMGEARLVEQIKTVCAEWPAYGYRRVTAELQGEGRVVNHKKVMRLMKESRLTVRPRRRFIAMTDSNHDGPIFPNLAKNIVPTYLNQLWSPTSPISRSISGIIDRTVAIGPAARRTGRTEKD